MLTSRRTDRPPICRISEEIAVFDLEQFIADLRNTLVERSRMPMKEVVARAIADPASLLR